MDDRLPKRSYELIAMLDETIVTPQMPVTVAQAMRYNDFAVREMCFQAGARRVVDELIAQMEEELSGELSEDPSVDGLPDASWGGLPEVFGPDGGIRKFMASLRVASDGTERRLDNGDKKE